MVMVRGQQYPLNIKGQLHQATAPSPQDLTLLGLEPGGRKILASLGYLATMIILPRWLWILVSVSARLGPKLFNLIRNEKSQS